MQTIPQIILAQLGNNVFIEKVGATHIAATSDKRGIEAGEEKGGNTLLVNTRENSKKIHCVSITLLPSDTYLMEFIRMDYITSDIQIINSIKSVYCDQLTEIFAEYTGIDLPEVLFF